MPSRHVAARRRGSAGRAPTAARTRRRSARPSALDAYGITGLPTDPRVAGGLPTQIITGFTDLGRQATNPQWQYPDGLQPEGQLHVGARPPLAQDGYEFQHIHTEVQDVNPLYGRDAYAGQFTRPAGAAANNLVQPRRLHVRAAQPVRAQQHPRSPNLRQNMHFAYVQDDLRVNDSADAEPRPALRVRDAAVGEATTSCRTSIRRRSTMVLGDGRIAARIGRRSIPTATTSARASASRARSTPKTVVRGGYGISYIHFHRAGGANMLPINGPQVINAVVEPDDPTTAGVPDDRAGLPGGPDRSVAVQSAARQHHLHARATTTRAACRAGSSRCSARSATQHARSTSPTSATAPTSCCCSPTTTRRRRTTPPGTLPLQARRPIPEFADITYSFNGGKSRYHSLQVKFEWRIARGLMLLNSFTCRRRRTTAPARSRARTATSRRRRTSTTSTPTTALSAYHQPYNNTTSVVWELPFGRGRRWLSDAGAVARRAARRLAMSGINTMTSGEPVTLHLHARRRSSRCRASSRTSAAPTTTVRTSIGDPYGDRDSVTNYFNRDNGDGADRSEPAVRQRAAQQRARPAGSGRSTSSLAKDFRLPIGTQHAARSSASRPSTCSTARTSARPNGNRSAGDFGTITQHLRRRASCSSA